MAFLNTRASQKGSALLIVLVGLLVVGAAISLTWLNRSGSSIASPIASSPSLYQAQIVSATPTPSPIAYVQSNSTALNGQKASVSSTYPSLQTQGNLNVIIIGWQGGGNSVSNVTDTLGNTYTQILQNHTTGISQALYYAKNINSGSNNIVKATFAQGAASAPDLIVLEYRNADTANPLNATHFQSGTGTLTPSSGLATNINPGELLIGAGMTNKLFTAPGSLYTQRALTAKAKNIAEDRVVSTSGSYDATATLNDATGYYVMQVATFKPAPAPSATPTPTPTPSPVASVSPTTLNFGSVTVGTISGVQYVTVTNAGTAALTFSAGAVSGDFAFGGTASNICSTAAPLAPGANCVFGLAFTPTLTGTRTGMLTINDNAANSPQTISLTGTGVSTYTYSQSAYYAYSQSSYYAYSQSSYYAYSQSAYTSGPTYYVSPTGNDANSGSLSAPWKTIQHAASTVSAGATVIVEDGTYQETVNMQRGGTSEGTRVTFKSQNKWGAKIVPKAAQ